MIRAFLRKARTLIESDSFRRALPFGLTIVLGLMIAWLAPRLPVFVNTLFLLCTILSALGASIAFGYASAFRHKFESGDFVAEEAKQSQAQASSFVCWFLAHDLAWAAVGWLLAFALYLSLGNTSFGRALMAAFSAAGLVFLLSALDAVRYWLQNRGSHFGIGWARPSPKEIRNLVLCAAATIFLPTRYETVLAQDLQSEDSLLRQYVALDQAIASDASEKAGVRVRVQPEIGAKESLYHGSTFGAQSALGFIIALLLLSFDTTPPAPFVYPPATNIAQSITATAFPSPANPATATSRAAAAETATAEQTQTNETHTAQPNQTPSPENGTGQPNSTASPENDTAQPNQTPSPDNGSGWPH